MMTQGVTDAIKENEILSIPSLINFMKYFQILNVTTASHGYHMGAHGRLLDVRTLNVMPFRVIFDMVVIQVS
jgi:hypothetical protein